MPSPLAPIDRQRVRLRFSEPEGGFGPQMLTMRAWLCSHVGPGQFSFATRRGVGGLRTIELPDAGAAAAFVERFGVRPA